MPMLEHPQNSGDNGSALQDTDGNVHGANQDDEHYHIPTLDLLGNVGDNGSVVLEDTKTVREDVMINSITSTNHNEITCGSCGGVYVFFYQLIGGNLRTMRRSKSQDASEIPNVAKVVYSCI
ncbi:hypothetical protein CK203_049797 [Vitis vinifera]|uniref:Uncharacterized protein n=1 Tax=Vitis vinifera TaxID=29760 RepID=A0A438H1R1_VITVI|nr:hypothetical protein CK203_049797 [Vitis vinifera]